MKSKYKNRLFFLDGIRVFSMFCILLYHFQIEAASRTVDFHILPYLGSEIHGTNIGHLGVSLFFILSGTCLTISQQTFRPREYYQKRWLAIFPSYYLVWGCAFAGTWLFMREKLHGIAWWTILLTLTGFDGYLYEQIPNFYMTGEWFTGCLLLLYLIYPLLRIAMERKPRQTALIVSVLWFVAAGFSSDLICSQPDHLFYLRIPEFLFGMYIGKYGRNLSGKCSPIGPAVCLTAFLLPADGIFPTVIRHGVMGMGAFAFLWVSG